MTKTPRPALLELDVEDTGLFELIQIHLIDF